MYEPSPALVLALILGPIVVAIFAVVRYFTFTAAIIRAANTLEKILRKMK